MEVIKYPSKADWPSLVKRPALDVTTLFDTVRTVLNEVRSEGDTAVKRYEEKFDKVTLSGLPAFYRTKGGNDLRSNLLAESSCHRKGRPVYSGRNGPFVLNRINVGGSCTYRRM